MAKAMTVKPPEWWKHLRPWGKRVFWKKERRAAARDAKGQA